MASKTDTKRIPARKRKPLGKALPVVASAPGAPTQEEVGLLVSLWDTYAPAQYRGMMNAQDGALLEETGQEPSGEYIWNAATLSYTNIKTGYVVDQDETLAALSAFVRAYSRA